MARPKEFDKDEALGGAIRVFTSFGFDGASTDDLLAGMKLSRQSMYDTFGDKRALYLAALRRYVQESAAEIIAPMQAEASALRGIEAALLAFAARPATRPEDGCLGVGATMEFGCRDPEVAAILDASGATLCTAFERVIRKGQDAGEIAAELDARTAARFLLTTLMGLKVSARAGMGRPALRDSAHLALRTLR